MDLRWAYYVLTAYDINSMDSGSAIPSTSRSDFYALPLLLPSLREQEAIAEVLSAIDDKIAVNHRAADASLDLAIEVFRHAIQQFSSAPIALSDAAKWMSGGTPTTTERSYWGGDIPWISALSLKSPWIDDSDRKVTALGANNGTRLAPKDTVIFVVRGSSLDTEFRVGLTRREVAFGQDCKALRALPGIDPALLFIALKSATSDILKLVDHTGHGAGRLATDMIGPHSIRLPAGDKAPASTALIRSLIDVGGKRQAENQNLGQLRDTLRSKLVTGQLRLHDAERLTGVAK
jgi:type I restriction enzyme S subunit